MKTKQVKFPGFSYLIYLFCGIIFLAIDFIPITIFQFKILAFFFYNAKIICQRVRVLNTAGSLGSPGRS